MILFASDLDNTLIYSYKYAVEGSICVESMEGRPLSYMTERAYHDLQYIADNAVFMPVTTRSIEQYNRVQLLKGRMPQYALVSNGGNLLRDGQLDSVWRDETMHLIDLSIGELERAVESLKGCGYVTAEVRMVDGMFVFTKATDTQRVVDMLTEQLNLELVSVDCNGQKVYVHPAHMDKGSALKRFKMMYGPEVMVCAGDSLFDLPMLKAADYSLMPAGAPVFEGVEFRRAVRLENTGMSFGDGVTGFVKNMVDGRL